MTHFVNKCQTLVLDEKLRFDGDTQHAFVGDYSGQVTLLKLDGQTCSVITTLKGHEGNIQTPQTTHI